MSDFETIIVHDESGEPMVEVPAKAISHTTAWQAAIERARQRDMGQYAEPIGETALGKYKDLDLDS